MTTLRLSYVASRADGERGAPTFPDRAYLLGQSGGLRPRSGAPLRGGCRTKGCCPGCLRDLRDAAELRRVRPRAGVVVAAEPARVVAGRPSRVAGARGGRGA